MTKISKLEPVFIAKIPENPEPGKIYISTEFRAVIHLCCCGCGRKVATPRGPNDWKLTYDGKTISVCPSIGNWSFPCRSHYWIRNGNIQWDESWSPEQVQAGRERDRRAKEREFATTPKAAFSLKWGIHLVIGFWGWLKSFWKK